jgi:hypothetical protein
VSLRVDVSRCPRTYSGRRRYRSRGRGHRRFSTDGHGRPGKGPSRCGAGAMRRPAAGIISEGRAPRRREGERCGRPWHSLPRGSGPRVRSPGCRSRSGSHGA